MTSIQPPIPPAGSIYTSCYCEENVYLLCQAFLSSPVIAEKWKIWVVFISNNDKRAALFFQKAARQKHLPVVWDYHVVLVLESREGLGHGNSSLPWPAPPSDRSWVYDFDTLLPTPCSWKAYLDMTCPVDILPEYESRFRVVAGEEFVENFASDRSHMIVQKADKISGAVTYTSPPPRYRAIVGAGAARRGVTTNLMKSFVSMESSAETFGTVYNRNGI